MLSDGYEQGHTEGHEGEQEASNAAQRFKGTDEQEEAETSEQLKRPISFLPSADHFPLF